MWVRYLRDFEDSDPIQRSIPTLGTKYGKMPYSVSLMEWEFLSTAIKTMILKSIMRAVIRYPGKLSGRYIQPYSLNHFFFFIIKLYQKGDDMGSSEGERLDKRNSEAKQEIDNYSQ